MSFDGHVLCQRILMGPCALTTLGATTVAAVATAAPLRNLRRVAASDLNCSVVMGIALLGLVNLPRGILGAAWVYEPSGRVPYSGEAGCRAGHDERQGSNCLAPPPEPVRAGGQGGA